MLSLSPSAINLADPEDKHIICKIEEFIPYCKSFSVTPLHASGSADPF